jgi:ABC-2 type transport system permease protein
MTPPTAPPGFRAVLRSEWTKLWAVRSTHVLLGVLLLLTVGVTGVLAFFGSSGDLAAAQEDGAYDVILFSATLGIWVYTYLGAAVVAAEFGGRAGQYTFVATPRRGRVLAAKMLIVGGLGAALGVVVALVNIALTQAALASAGSTLLDLGDPGLWRAALVFVALSMAVQAWLGAAVAVLVRTAFGALAIVVLVNALPVTTAQFLGEGYRSTVPRLVPGAAVESAAGLSVPGSDGHLPLGAALLVVAAWLGLAHLLAHRRLVRADLR